MKAVTKATISQKRVEKQHHAEQEEQVIVAREHLLGTYAGCIEKVAYEHALLCLLGDRMRGGGAGGNTQCSNRRAEFMPTTP